MLSACGRTGTPLNHNGAELKFMGPKQALVNIYPFNSHAEVVVILAGFLNMEYEI